MTGLVWLDVAGLAALAVALTSAARDGWRAWRGAAQTGPLPYAVDDPRLWEVLRQAFEEWGAVEVAITAALLSDRHEVVRALTVTDTEAGRDA